MLDDDDLIIGTKKVIRPLWRWAFTFIAIGAFVCVGLALGFIQFANHKVTRTADPAGFPPADGIVVVTGGQERIERSFELLLHDAGERLLISGVGLCITKEGVRYYLGNDDSDKAIARFDCCVDLDRKAADTFGNARATKDWAATHGYDRVIIVTSAFHMARTSLIFKSAMPDIDFIPYPVVPKAYHGVEWWQDRGIINVMIREYGKFLLTWADLKRRIILGRISGITSGD